MLRLLTFLAALCVSASAWAQTAVPPFSMGTMVCAYNSSLPTITTGSWAYVQCDSNGRLISTGGGGGGSSGGGGVLGAFFQPSGNLSTPLTVTTTSSNTAIPSGSPNTILVSNGGTVGIYVHLGVGAGTAATTSDPFIAPNGGGALLALGSNTYVAAITASGTSTATVAGGAGMTATSYGINVDESTSSQLHTDLTAAVPLIANSAVDPTAATDATNVAGRADDYGNVITWPYAPRGLVWSSSSGATTGTSMTFSGSSKTNYYTYITDVVCGRSDTGTTAITATLNDGATTIFVLPNGAGGGGNNHSYLAPLKVTSTSTAPTVTLSSGVTSAYCTLTGFFAKS